MEKRKSQKRRPGPAPKTPWDPRIKRHALVLGGLILFLLLVYSNSFHGPFLFDSADVIPNDARLRAATSENLYKIFTQEYWATVIAGLYRPLTTLSYLFNYSILGNGLEPAGYHWVNFLVHAANACLVYALGLAVFGEIPVAALLAALWGAHPALTESVTNVVGRGDLLAAFGVLAALLFHIRATGKLRIAGVALAAAVGICAKESAIVVIPVLILWDLAFAGREWRARVPDYVAAAVPCALFLAWRAWVMSRLPYQAHFPFPDNPLLGAGFLGARLTAVKVIGEYLALLAWPAALSPDYSYNQVPLFAGRWNTWEDWKTVAALVVCAAAAAGAILARRRHKPVFFFIGLFFAALAPTSNLLMLIGSIKAERFLYLPALGFAGLMVWAAFALLERRRAAPVALALIAVAFGARTWARNLDWQDQQRFWRSAAAAAPQSFKPHNMLAGMSPLAKPEEIGFAVREIGRAVSILDGLPDLENTGATYHDAGVIYRAAGDRLAASGDAAGAAPWYRKSLDAFLRQERIELAQDAWKRAENARHGKPALRYVPAEMYLQMGRTYLRLGDTRSAVAAFERGRALAPDPQLLEEMSAAYTAAGNPRQAALAAVEALAVDSKRMYLMAKLVDLYRTIDPGGCAVNAQGLNVECPLVHGDICTASRNVAETYARRDQGAEAAAVRDAAVRELGCAAETVR